MKVAIYARVSKADRGDPNSVPVQLADCRERAAGEGWEVAGEFVDEGASAWDPHRRRPGYERMLAGLEAGEFAAVLVREQERLLRQMRDAVRLADLAEAGRLRLIACTLEGDLVLSRARDRKDFRDRASSAQFYSDFLSEKIRRTHKRKRENGEWKGGGTRPFGYEVVGPRPFRVEVNPAEAELLRRAAEDVLAGASLRSVCAAWNAAGVATSGGGTWKPGRLGQVLRSEHLAGRAPGVPAVLDPDLWEALAALLGDPERARFAAPRTRRHFLVGLAKCGRCGTGLTGHRRPNRARGYVCRSGPRYEGCGRLRIAADQLEELVSEEVHRRREALDRRGAPRPGPGDPEAAAELREVRARLVELAEMLGRRELRTEEYLAARAPLLEDEARAAAAVGEAERRGARRRIHPAVFERAQTWAEAIQDEAFVLWNVEAARELVERVEVAPASRRGAGWEPGRVRIVWREEPGAAA